MVYRSSVSGVKETARRVENLLERKRKVGSSKYRHFFQRFGCKGEQRHGTVTGDDGEGLRGRHSATWVNVDKGS